MTPLVFTIHIILGFCSGWAVVAAVTSIADTLGTGPAGFLGGLPSTGAVGLLFIGWSQSQASAVQAATIFPLAFSVTLGFLFFYARPGRLSFTPRFALALGLWLTLSLLLVDSGIHDFYVCFLGSLIIATTIFSAHSRMGLRDVAAKRSTFGLGQMVWRGVLGGSVVASVIILSTLGGPVLGGVFAAAPAIWASSLVVAYRAHGLEFSKSLTGSFVRTSILTVIPYGIAARFLFQAVGVWWGTLIAYIVILPTAWLAWRRAHSFRHVGLTSDAKHGTSISLAVRFPTKQASYGERTAWAGTPPRKSDFVSVQNARTTTSFLPLTASELDKI